MVGHKNWGDDKYSIGIGHSLSWVGGDVPAFIVLSGFSTEFNNRADIWYSGATEEVQISNVPHDIVQMFPLNTPYDCRAYRAILLYSIFLSCRAIKIMLFRNEMEK